MCLCKGTGKVILEEKGVIQWNPCPDSNCKFDKEESERKWLQFKQEIRAWERELIEGRI